ncbi:MAG: hypothetical protein ACP5NW_00575 [Candidatus Woesearchaeota archaeon]
MLQNIPKDKILAIVKQGPTFPAKIAKQLGIGGDTVLVGAILSTLISTGEVKVSSLKIGGSPLYYVPEQESKLEEFIDHLNDKDRKTFKLIKDEKVLQDSEQDPLTRVSLRAIKDFAKSFELSHQGQKFLFWRFYNVSVSDVEPLARGMIKKIPVEESKPDHKSEAKPEPQLALKSEAKTESKPDSKSTSGNNTVDILVDKTHVEKHAEVQEILENVEEHKHAIQEKSTVHMPEHEQKHPHAAHEHHDKSKSHQHTSHKVTKDIKSKAPKSEYNFYELILNHVSEKKLDIISKEKIKKTEYDLILKNHDNNEYIYCKAKDKPSVNEGDLAPAMIFAQNKRMPCLFLTTGELTKKAELMLGKELSALKFERIKIHSE